MRARVRHGERGIALLMALIMIILIAALVASYLAVSASNLRVTVSSHDSLQALYVAETGLAEALHELSVANIAAFKDEDGKPAPLKGPYKGTYSLDGTYTTTNDYNQNVRVGDYTVQLNVLETDPSSGESPLVMKLSSRGEYNGIKRTVEASLVHAPSPRIDHAVLAAGDLTIRGNLIVMGDVHANGAVTVNGGAAEIFPANPMLSDLSNPPHAGAFGGNLTAGNGISSIYCWVAGLQDGAAPPVVVYNIAPEMVAAVARDLGWVVEERRPGGPTYTEAWRGTLPDNGDLTCPDGCPGKMILVYGDVSLRGCASGNVVIVATGNVDISGNVMWGGVPGDGVHLMIVAGGDVTIRGNAQVNGIVFAGGTLTGAGNAVVMGGLVSAGTQESVSTFAGSLFVSYARPAGDVEDLLKRWQLISWRQASGDES